MRRLALGTLTAVLTLALAAPAQAHAPAPGAAGDRGDRAAYPQLKSKRVVTGLDHPWDVRPIGNGRLIFTQRDRARVSIWAKGKKRAVRGFPSNQVWVSGETGLMGLEVHPRFGRNHVFFTCQGGTTSGGGHDVRVMRWKLNDGLRRITGSKRLLGGLPASSGRHGGCRLLAVGKKLYVGTGDAAVGTNPRNKKSLGGKVLCLTSKSGKACGSNPWRQADNRKKRYVYTFGHRNVQGLDRRGNGTLWSVEQGSYRDDEVNRLRSGGDYGWNPVPGYDESVPMTDQSLPGKQREAVWSSGSSTIATSGGGFVTGRGLGKYAGTFAVAALKAERVVFLKLSKAGKLKGTHAPAGLQRFGRIRTVVDGPGPAFYLTTDNGDGNDAIIRVRPRR